MQTYRHGPWRAAEPPDQGAAPGYTASRTLPQTVVTILSVLRSGGEFRPRHVRWLAAQVERFTGRELVTIADVPLPGRRLPMRHDWPGWWSKMEMFRPDIGGDIFFLDLDTVIVDRIDDLLDIGRTAVLRDVSYGGTAIQSSVMYVTAADRARIWAAWSADPAGIIARLRGDQDFLSEVIPEVARWQDVRPGRFVSYRKHIRNAGAAVPPMGAGVVVFHGKPRPWRTWFLRAWPYIGRPAWIPPLPRD